MAFLKVNPLIEKLRTDVTELVSAYMELDTTCFLEFVRLWNERGFHLIYAGQGETDIDYFIFHILHAAKSHCAGERVLAERVGALYALYLLYYTQPLKAKLCIRLTHDEFEALHALAQHFKDLNPQVSYAFYKLVVDEGLEFVVTSLPYDECLLHYKEDLPTEPLPGAGPAVGSARGDVLGDAAFDSARWSDSLRQYNALKRKLSSSTSVLLEPTIDFTCLK